MNTERKFTIVCGHYGCGKSNFALNLAVKRAEEGKKVILLDLDLVNPYFLSSGYKDMLNEKGIQVIAPMYANTNVDIPALPADMYSVFETDADVIMDVGGDDAGSMVLGRFYQQLQTQNYEMLYVINCYRNLTQTPQEAAQILEEIEKVSRCRMTALVNNSHLKADTTWETIKASLDYATQTSDLLHLPLVATTIPTYLEKDDRVRSQMEKEASRVGEWLPIEIYVKAPWE